MGDLDKNPLAADEQAVTHENLAQETASPPPGGAAAVRRPRWRLAVGVLVVAALAWMTLEPLASYFEWESTGRAISLGVVGAGTLLALAAWWLFLSGVRWKVRGAVAAAVALALGLTALSLRLDGVDGDLWPSFAWRWSDPTAQTPPVKGLVNRAAENEEPLIRLVAGRYDFPGFLGPERRPILPGPELGTDWETNPPELLWKQPIGEGWSSYAIVGDYAITQESREEQELVVCYELLTGRLVWTHADDLYFASPRISGNGPRATPTIHDGLVYTSGATGYLNCINAETGQVVWARDTLADDPEGVPQWGKSCSPLVTERHVIVSGGNNGPEALLAYDRLTGEPAWTGGDDGASYSSPQLSTLAGIEQIVIFNRGSVSSHDPATGDTLWTFPWWAENPNVAQPLPVGHDRLLISSGYGHGCSLLQVSQTTDGQLQVEELWHTRNLKAKFTNIALHEGYAYGLDDGILVCLDLSDGKRAWKEGRYGHGQVLLVGDVLLVLSEKGELVAVEPTPEKLTVLASLPVLEGKTWNNPALSGQHLLVRNATEAACYVLPLAAPEALDRSPLSEEPAADTAEASAPDGSAVNARG